MDLKNIKKLIELLEQSQLEELTVEEEGFKVSLKKHTQKTEVKMAPTVQAEELIKSQETKISSEKKSAPSSETGLTPIVAPIVGTFYRAPSPDAPPFVEVGDQVKPGQPICIIEAMKMFNEIVSEVSGRVAKILAANGETVEYGQVIMLIDENNK